MKEKFNSIYNILVKLGGASEMMREAFIHAQIHDCREWRFGGKLGHGGKYWNYENQVNCYSEDLTKERQLIIDNINSELKQFN